MVASFDKAKEIFLVALERPPGDWDAFVAQACCGDEELRNQVARLLKAHAEGGSLFEGDRSGREPIADSRITEGAGSVIGPYKLLERIGEGGCGVVFMAEQTEPIRRRVALKVLKPGMDSRQVVARFEAERQALALMDHPNIAHVHDGGTTPSGRPFFVMELVRGVPITDYCDTVRMAPRERLKLFQSVCQAIQHAHQKGIIHRDIKPSNVLITEKDGLPQVKVIDFGIAKALGQQLTEKTLFTNFALMVGTPLYMSPEQAGLNSDDVDTRGDVYSLGVLLYELLTGTTPFDKERLKKSAFDEIRRIIREEEPPRPSTRLTDSNGALPSISAQRQTDPAKLTKLVRGELDWIVMKCLEKDRERRYGTANGLAMDVQRYLEDSPVQARPQSAAYRLRKFGRRHRGSLAAISCIAFLALAATLGTAWGWFRAMAAENATLTESLARAQAQKDSDEHAALAKERDLWRRRYAYVSDFQVYQSRTSHDREWVRAMLARHVPAEGQEDVRGFEWKLVERQWTPGLPLFVLNGHTSDVRNVAFSPDGKLLATASWDFSIGLWDVRTGERVDRLWGHVGEVQGVVFSPDGKLIASCGNDWCVRLWDVASRKQLKWPWFAITPKSHMRSIAFAKDGRSVFSGGQDLMVHRWDVTTGKELQAFGGHLKCVESLEVSPSGEHLLAVCDERVKLWELATGRELFTRDFGGHSVASGGFDDDGNHIWLGCGTRILRFDLHGVNQGDFEFANGVVSMALHPTQRDRLVAGYSIVQLLDRHGQRVRTLGDHTNHIWCMRFSPNGKLLATASRDRTACIWDMTEPVIRTISFRAGAPIGGLAMTQDGKLAYTAHVNGRLRCWSVASGQLLREWTLPIGTPVSLELLPDQNTVAFSGTDPSCMGLLDLRTGTVHQLDHRSPRVCISPDGKYVAGKDRDNARHFLWLYELGTKRRSRPLGEWTENVPFPADGRALLFQADSRALLVGGGFGPSRLYDIRTGDFKIVAPEDQHPQVTSVTCSGRGLLALGYSAGRIRILNSATLQDYSAPDIRVPGGILSMAFTPDGRTLAVGCNNGFVRLVNVATGVVVYSHYLSDQPVPGVAFTPDGQTLIAAGGQLDFLSLSDPAREENSQTPGAIVPMPSSSRGGPNH